MSCKVLPSHDIKHIDGLLLGEILPRWQNVREAVQAALVLPLLPKEVETVLPLGGSTPSETCALTPVPEMLFQPSP